ILGERAVERGIDRRAAQFHDDRLAGEPLDIGKRLDKNVGGDGCIHHDVLTFISVIPAKAGLQLLFKSREAAKTRRKEISWTPACAGSTTRKRLRAITKSSHSL